MIDVYDKVMMTVFLFLILLISYIGVNFLRKYSIKNKLIDIPNSRSSHTEPTPRGGGLVIPISLMAALFYGFIMDWIAIKLFLALGVGGILVALVGWLDDHKHINTLWRASAYLISSAWAIFILGGFDTIAIGNMSISLAGYGSVLSVFGVAWLTNLYNFMDGIDGLAATQAIYVGAITGCLLLFNGNYGLAIVCLTLASSSGGFLIWNWPPAKIFMGDVGSCSLGFFFGVLAIECEKSNAISIFIWILLLSVFIYDATFTLIKRIIYREQWFKAHRSHAYQLLIQYGMKHSTQLNLIILMNLLIFAPMAIISHLYSGLIVYSFIASILFTFIMWFIIQTRFSVHLK